MRGRCSIHPTAEYCAVVQLQQTVTVQVNTATSALTYMSVGYDNSWNHDKWAKSFEIQVVSAKPERAVFELINIDPSVVNSLRRILIAEVPSVAIENVFVVDYDCVVPEEVLSHRLGLVPLSVDAEQLEEKNEEKGNHTNTVVFKLHVVCRKVRNDLQYAFLTQYSSRVQQMTRSRTSTTLKPRLICSLYPCSS